MKKWNKLHRELVREPYCAQEFVDDDPILTSAIFLARWKEICRELVRESLCFQEYLEKYYLSKDFAFSKRWKEMYQEIVRESLCLQVYLDREEVANERNDDLTQPEIVLSENFFNAWIFGTGLKIVTPDESTYKYCNCVSSRV